jgi:acetyl esterase/lipase
MLRRSWRSAPLGIGLAVLLSFPLLPSVAVAATGPCTPESSECNVHYGADDKQVLDAFYVTKTAGGLRPAVLFIHGGAWEGGDKHDQFFVGGRPLPRILAERTGWVTFSMNYRLSGATPTPYLDEPADVDAAVRWIKTNAAAYSIDPNRVALVGWSAGGHLALFDAFTHPTGDPGHVKAVVSWSGPTDMVTLAAYWRCVPVGGTCMGGLDIGQAIYKFEGNCALFECPTRYLNTSPLQVADVNDPPALLVHGIADPVVPVEQALELKAKRAQKTDLHLCPDSTVRSVATTVETAQHKVNECAAEPTISYLVSKL